MTNEKSTVMKSKLIVFMMTLLMTAHAGKAGACTGITLKTQAGETILARTIEWAGSNLGSSYVIVPRGYRQRSYVPGGKKDGMDFAARYGYVGMSVETKEFVSEGLNEEGLSVGLFYFPGYGKYEDYMPEHRQSTVSDLQLVSWLLGECRTVDEVKRAIGRVHVVSVYPNASTVHWRIADASGRQVVLEIVDRKPRFYENRLGVLTNSPGFEWHLTNLNNYINLFPGKAGDRTMGNITLSSIGGGSGMLGLPGDFTPPSRFIRAAFFQTTAPRMVTAGQAVRQCFQILNNFDIPVGAQFLDGENMPDIPSATQWTAVTDIRNRRIYYRTMYNSMIRCIELNNIRFDEVKYRSAPLDKVTEQPIEVITVE